MQLIGTVPSLLVLPKVQARSGIEPGAPISPRQQLYYRAAFVTLN